MAYPVNARWTSRTPGVTPISAGWANATDDALIGLYGGGKTVVSLDVDGVGNQAGGPGAGNIRATGNVVAGGRVTADSYLKSFLAKSSATPGSGQAVAAGEIWKDTVIQAWGKFRVTAGPAITFDRGANVASITYVGVGIYEVTLQTAVANLQCIQVTPMDNQAGIAVVDSGAGGGTAPTTTVFRIKYFDAAGNPTEPNSNVGGFFFAVIGG